MAKPLVEFFTTGGGDTFRLSAVLLVEGQPAETNGIWHRVFLDGGIVTHVSVEEHPRLLALLQHPLVLVDVSDG